MACIDPDCCKSMAHTAEVKVCHYCRTEIRDGGCLLCQKCAQNSNKCNHCGISTIEGEKMSTESLLGKLFGLTEKEAIEKIEAAGLKARVRKRDGQSFMGTCDARSDRINLVIEKDRVTATTIG